MTEELKKILEEHEKRQAEKMHKKKEVKAENDYRKKEMYTKWMAFAEKMLLPVCKDAQRLLKGKNYFCEVLVSSLPGIVEDMDVISDVTFKFSTIIKPNDRELKAITFSPQGTSVLIGSGTKKDPVQIESIVSQDIEKYINDFIKNVLKSAD